MGCYQSQSQPPSQHSPPRSKNRNSIQRYIDIVVNPGIVVQSAENNQMERETRVIKPERESNEELYLVVLEHERNDNPEEIKNNEIRRNFEFRPTKSNLVNLEQEYRGPQMPVKLLSSYDQQNNPKNKTLLGPESHHTGTASQASHITQPIVGSKQDKNIINRSEVMLEALNEFNENSKVHSQEIFITPPIYIKSPKKYDKKSESKPSVVQQVIAEDLTEQNHEYGIENSLLNKNKKIEENKIPEQMCGTALGISWKTLKLDLD